MPQSGAGLDRILANIELAETNIGQSRNVKTVALVTGSEEDRLRWEKRLKETAPFVFNRDGSTFFLSLLEKTGDKTKEGNFLGSLLAYSRIKEEAENNNISYREHVSMIEMLFGRGERMSPFTQIEGDCKPAIASTAANIPLKSGKVSLTEAEEAFKFFSPVAVYIQKRGFKGVLNKWGDQTEIASVDLGKAPDEGEDMSSFDMIKFISVLKVNDSLAEQKDWVVFDEKGDMVSQVSRNKKDILIDELKASGVRPRDDGAFHAGISLGPVAVSYEVMDIAEEVFSGDVKKPGVQLDFDPYVLMAFAVRGDRGKWDELMSKDKYLQELAGSRGMVPDLFDKVNIVRDVFRNLHKRELNLKVVNLGDDIFWTEVGQHDAMREKYLSLNREGEKGIIARRLEGVTDKRDGKGNMIVNSNIDPLAEITNTVIINSEIRGRGKITGSVIKDSVLEDADITGAFSVKSHRTGRTVLAPGSGIYGSLGSSLDELVLDEGMRHGTLLTSGGPVDMMVSETTDLRDKDKTYNVRIFGNRMSFSEAYDEMFGVGDEELNKRRREEVGAIERIDKMNKNFKQLRFGTSGLRDTVENMTDMECYINTRGFVSYLKNTGEFNDGDSIALAGDRRPSTPRIKRAVAAAVRDSGGVVDDQGLVPSPALAYYAMKRGIPSIMVTGSHIPADRNGIKFTKISGEVLKSDEEGILAAVAAERKKVYRLPEGDSLFDEKGMFNTKASSEVTKLLKEDEYEGVAAVEYIERYKEAFKGMEFPFGTKLFLYQHSAVGRDILREIFESIGAEIVAPDEDIDLEYSEETGKKTKSAEPLRSKDFVPVDTESVSDKTLSVFKKVMNDRGIDIGMSMDGDSDRPLLVYRVYKDGRPTEEVKYVTGDILGLLTLLSLEDIGVAIDAACIPVSANDAILKVLEEKGVELTLTKIGSPYVIDAMNASKRGHEGPWNVFSWESNGGFLTGADLDMNGKTLKVLPTRDAALPLIMVIMYSMRQKVPVSELLDRLPRRFTHADRKKEFPVETSRAIIEFFSPKEERDVRQVDFKDDSKASVVYSDGRTREVQSGSEFHRIKDGLEKVFKEKEGFSKVKGINYIDGIRIFFANGEISHLRPSGNAPEFRNYAIADTPERAKEIVEIGIRDIIPGLARMASRKKE